MILTLKQMDNLQQIECDQRVCNLFFIFNLSYCKSVVLKENTTITHSFQNHYSEQTKHTSIFLMERLGCHTKGWNWGGRFLCKTKSLNFPLFLFYWISPPVTLSSSDHRPRNGKKGISNSFQKNFTKNFACGIYFQQHNHE